MIEGRWDGQTLVTETGAARRLGVGSAVRHPHMRNGRVAAILVWEHLGARGVPASDGAFDPCR